MDRPNFLRRTWGKLRWFVKWKIIRFPDTVEDYGFRYAFLKEFIHPWWYPLIYGVGNLFSYFTLIWSDRDWDYHFWIKMNLKKLRRMEKLLREHGNHLYAERDADNIHKAVLALERLMADDYMENAFHFHDQKYGKLNIDWVDCEHPGCKQMVSSRSKTVTERDEHYEHKASRKLYKHSDYMKQQDIEYANKIISKYLFHWWD